MGLTVPARSPSPHSRAAQVVLGKPRSPWSLPVHPTGTFPLCPTAEAQSRAPGSCCSLGNFNLLYRLNKCLSREF